MAQRAGRITCPRCGANNFDTVTSCWKCGAPVGAGAITAPSSMGAPPAAPPNVQSSYSPSPQPGMPGSYSPERQIVMGSAVPISYAPAAPNGDSGVARRAALALGLTLPFIGLPVGWIFMMIEDRSRQTIGRWCAIWSTVGLVLHLLLTVFLFQQSGPILMRILVPIMEGASRRNAAGGDGTPGLP